MSQRDRNRRQQSSSKHPSEAAESASNRPAAEPAAESAASTSGDSTAAGQREQKPPKRVRFGLKIKSKEEISGRSETAAQWLETLNEMVDPEGRQEGFEYARIGQTIRMEIRPGRVDADVQGRRGRPYAVTIEFDTLSTAQWSAMIDSLASEAAHVAKLLADELPEQFAAMLASRRDAPATRADASRSDPPSDDDQPAAHHTVLGRPQTTCQCGYPRPCKHFAAVGYLLAERLDNEPLTALTLLGMASEELKEQLRQKRVMKTQGLATAHPDQLAALANEQPMPLETCVDEFWRYGPQLSELEQTPLPHHAPHALLRRLGPSPLNGRFPMVGLLASVYDTVTRAAIELRDSAERSNGD